MRKWLLIPVFVLIAGCGKNRQMLQWPASIQSLEGLTTETRQVVLGAVDDMNGRMRRQLLATQENPVTYQIVIEVVEPWADNPSRAGYSTVYDDHCLIQLSQRIFQDGMQDYIKPVLWHEIGHCTGLTHVAQEGEVMYKSSVPLTKYSAEALQRFFNTLHQSAGI